MSARSLLVQSSASGARRNRSSRRNPEPLPFLRNLAEGHEKQKAGAKRDYLKELEDSEYQAVEHRFAYPSGTNSEGGRYQPGFAVHRHFAVDTSVVSVFVDVADSVRETRSKAIDDAVERFFSSLVIRDE